MASFLEKALERQQRRIINGKIIGTGIGLCGIVTVIAYSGWMTALGVFLCIYANNLTNKRI